MKSLLSSHPGTDLVERPMARTETGRDGVQRTPAPIAAPAAAPGPLASFARFVLLGGGVGVASSFAVTSLAGMMPWAVSNALVTVASTVLCTELHARFTFGAGRRAGWRQHLQSAGSASAAYAVTTLAMLILHIVQPSAGTLREQAVYLSASALAGIGRFLVLRLYVFAAGRNRAPERAKGRAKRVTVSPSIPAQRPVRPMATARTLARMA
ncbi:GtrA family protein [Streptomyces sp. NPDC093109]|uniref:GtrA family protein n=1 Tax=Streptomyces sp. NPDC093109 TaxID=3154977 RepID=UPI003451015E